MGNKHQVLQNPDVPAEAIVKQLLVENGQLKSEIQYLENELANKNRAIKAFKKWQRDVTERTIEQWLKEATSLEEPLLSAKVTNIIKDIVKIGNRLMSRRGQAILFIERIKALVDNEEIQELLNNNKDEDYETDKT